MLLLIVFWGSYNLSFVVYLYPINNLIKPFVFSSFLLCEPLFLHSCILNLNLNFVIFFLAHNAYHLKYFLKHHILQFFLIHQFLFLQLMFLSNYVHYHQVIVHYHPPYPQNQYQIKNMHYMGPNIRLC